MIEEALQGLASASGAHTISSAPKEGEDALLLYCPEQGGWHVGKWLAPRWVAAINAEHVLNPTHWMHVPASPVPKPWTRDEALELFRMDEDRGWAVKQQMVSIVAWVTPIVFALLALSAKEYCAPWVFGNREAVGEPRAPRKRNGLRHRFVHVEPHPRKSSPFGQ